ncbi:MAG: homoserine kinase [Cyanobacteria bacterium J06635_1]
MSSIAQVTVPATTANIGPGFDCLGAALTLYNQFEFAAAEAGVQISVEGKEAHRVRTDKGNLAYRAFAALYKKLGQAPPPVNLTIKLAVPLSRGLGSSSTAIVGGVMGANLLAGCPLDNQELAAIATELEGHPDNVVPALLGGCRLAATDHDKPWTLCEIPWHKTIVPIVAIPDFELSTAEARRVLPKTYSRADAIFNTAHLGLLLRGLSDGRGDWLRAALADRIHQPYRKKLIAGYDTVYQAALEAGAWGLVISGAGPTLLALASPERAEAVQQAMKTVWLGYGFVVDVKRLSIDPQGAVGKIL